eukprot:CAMPEP_0174383034 /NCGR_PEP_ID=MMETSP0811_2-20130205/124963_1 /TAXON_ID=73025 ORGANISM="Eutreptiella gymnastica-like, Strain CCMP1594" /NCGR_SAMPLE_ID=MMETSP0811_2 /ASSEMBLY_ACC=CAM_ASM_000667 /LENGTH=43 /DNA_ID= /DNA_START= /DNA_END= /DNA_ORIENTATION=
MTPMLCRMHAVQAVQQGASKPPLYAGHGQAHLSSTARASSSPD